MNSNWKIVESEKQDKSFFETNQKAFKELLTFVDFADEKLNIAFAEINFDRDRDVLIEKLIKHPSCKNIQFETLDLSDHNIRFVRDELIAALQDIRIVPDKKLILLVTGLEKPIGVLDEYPDVLVNLNYVRDDLSKTVPYPMLIFLPDYALTRLAKYAPDFWSWGRKTFYFKTIINNIKGNSSQDSILQTKNINNLENIGLKKERISLLLRILGEKDFGLKQNLPVLTTIYRELSVLFFILGDYQQAIFYGSKLLSILKKIGDRNGESYCLKILGDSYDCLGKYKKAINFHLQALDIAKDTKDINAKSVFLNSLGNAYYSLGEYQKAIDFYQQALNIARELGDIEQIGLYLNNLGSVYNDTENYQQAINFIQQSLKIQQKIGNRYVESLSLRNLGISYKAIGAYEKAINYLQQSLKISNQIKDLDGEASALNSLGRIYNDIEKYGKAIDYHLQSLKIQRKIGDLYGEGLSLMNLGNIKRNLLRNSEAKRAFLEARQLFQDMKLVEYVKDCDRAIQELEN